MEKYVFTTASTFRNYFLSFDLFNGNSLLLDLVNYLFYVYCMLSFSKTLFIEIIYYLNHLHLPMRGLIFLQKLIQNVRTSLLPKHGKLKVSQSCDLRPAVIRYYTILFVIYSLLFVKLPHGKKTVIGNFIPRLFIPNFSFSEIKFRKQNPHTKRRTNTGNRGLNTGERGD